MVLAYHATARVLIHYPVPVCFRQGHWRVAEGVRPEEVAEWLTKGEGAGFFAVVTTGEGADLSHSLLVSTASAEEPVETLVVTSTGDKHSLGEGQEEFGELAALIEHYGQNSVAVAREDAGTVYLLRGVASEPTETDLEKHVELAAKSNRRITNAALVSLLCHVGVCAFKNGRVLRRALPRLNFA